MTNGNLVIDVFLEDLKLSFREIIDGAIDGLSAGDERNLMIYIRTVRGELLGILFFEDVGKFSVFGRDGRRRVGNNGINMDTVST